MRHHSDSEANWQTVVQSEKPRNKRSEPVSVLRQAMPKRCNPPTACRRRDALVCIADSDDAPASSEGALGEHMGQFVRRHLRWIAPVALCVASMVGSTQANISRAPPGRSAFDAPRRAQDEALPPQARRGTGMLGLLSPRALDAVAAVLHAARRSHAARATPAASSTIARASSRPGSARSRTSPAVSPCSAPIAARRRASWRTAPNSGRSCLRRDGRHLMLYRFDDSRLPTAEPLVSPRASRPRRCRRRRLRRRAKRRPRCSRRATCTTCWSSTRPRAQSLWAGDAREHGAQRRPGCEPGLSQQRRRDHAGPRRPEGGRSTRRAAT